MLCKTVADSLQTPERWSPIPGFWGYDVSDFGQVRSWRTDGPGIELASEPHLLVPVIGSHGYLIVSLMRDGKAHTKSVAALVLTTFVGPRPEGHQSAHNNGNPWCNTVENLRWATPKSNAADRVAHGTAPIGEKNPSAKLTRDEARAILESREPTSVLVARYSVSRATIKLIRARKLWRCLEAA
jgi:hypothetical protein